jgi:hypothetical protein
LGRVVAGQAKEGLARRTLSMPNVKNLNYYKQVAKTLYAPDALDGSFPEPNDYNPIIEHFGRVVIRVEDDDYSGDTQLLYADNGNGFGYLSIGWGSCSGCDALAGCESYKDIAELIQHLESTIKWASREDMLQFFKEHDWEGDFWRDKENCKDFVKQVIAYLESLQ